MCASENDIIEEEAIKEKHNSIEGIIFNFLLQWMNDTEWMTGIYRSVFMREAAAPAINLCHLPLYQHHYL